MRSRLKKFYTVQFIISYGFILLTIGLLTNQLVTTATQPGAHASVALPSGQAAVSVQLSPIGASENILNQFPNTMSNITLLFYPSTVIIQNGHMLGVPLYRISGTVSYDNDPQSTTYKSFINSAIPLPGVLPGVYKISITMPRAHIAPLDSPPTQNNFIITPGNVAQLPQTSLYFGDNSINLMTPTGSKQTVIENSSNVSLFSQMSSMLFWSQLSTYAGLIVLCFSCIFVMIRNKSNQQRKEKVPPSGPPTMTPQSPTVSTGVLR